MIISYFISNSMVYTFISMSLASPRSSCDVQLHRWWYDFFLRAIYSSS